MKIFLRALSTLVAAITLVSISALTPFVSAAASSLLTIDGNTKYQTITGLGASINSDSWDNGALRPVLDQLIDQNGTKTFRVVMDMMDWESTNDNADPSVFNWTYYNPIYSGASSFDTTLGTSNFANLWNTIDYLHTRGIPDSQIILSFMGPGPSWLSGSKTQMAASKEDEFVETILSAAYYGYNHGHTFGAFAPNNEADLTNNQEGIVMDPTVYADSMNKLAGRMGSLGMSNVRLLGPETGGTNSSYVDAMEAYPALMAKVDHFDFHNYGGSTGNASSVISGSGKDFWMSEFSIFDHAFNLLQENASGLLMWDAYDSVYSHAILNGLGSQPGSDAGNAPAWIAYNDTTKAYDPRLSFYQYGQLFKYVPLGSVRIGATDSSGNVDVVAFKDPVSGRVTIVGQNNNSTAQTMNVSLSGIGTAPNKLSYYQTNSTSNMAQGADVPVTGGTASITVPANTVFTLTGNATTDTSAPTVPANLVASAASSSQVNLTWSASTDNVGVAGYVVKRNGVIIAQPATTSYSSTGLGANTTYLYTVAAKDTSGNVSAYSTAVNVTTPADTQAPTTPTALTAVTASSTKVNLNWTASTDNVGVTGYAIYRGSTQIGTSTSPSYIDTTVTAGNTYSYTVKAYDAAANTSASSTAASVTVTATTSVWAANAVPGTASDADSSAVEVGMKFRSDVAGKVNAIRFYKGAQNIGTHVGHLWNSAGTPLATINFTGETASGWQQATLLTPVDIAANTTYTVSYYAPVGHYAGDNNYFATQGVDNAPLHSLANGADGTNGVYRYGSGGGFPTSSYQSSNYWVDVVFSANGS